MISYWRLKEFLNNSIINRREWANSKEGKEILGPGSPTIPVMQDLTQILSWVEANELNEEREMIKSVEPIPGLLLYFNTEDKGKHCTAKCYSMALPSWNMMFEKKETGILTFNCDGWRVALLDEDDQDNSWHWRTYVAINGNKFFTFHLPNELKGSEVEFRKRFHGHLEANTKEAPMNKPTKMTREQALEKCKNLNNWPDILEALGVIEFEGERKIIGLLKITNKGDLDWCGRQEGIKIGEKYGTVKLEQWPEGLVLWIGGKIVWKSWEKYYKKGDGNVTIRTSRANLYEGVIEN